MLAYVIAGLIVAGVMMFLTEDLAASSLDDMVGLVVLFSWIVLAWPVLGMLFIIGEFKRGR